MNDYALIQKTAEHLARRPVSILYRSMPDCLGMCAKDTEGRVVITLNENMGDDMLFRTLLHEAAHARLHAGTLPTMTQADTVKYVMATAPTPTTPLYTRREVEADEWESVLYDYASKKAASLAGRCRLILGLVETTEGNFKAGGSHYVTKPHKTSQ